MLSDMFHGDHARGHDPNSVPVTVIFVGNSLVFPDTFLKVLQDNLRDIGFLRVPDLGQLSVQHALHPSLELVVLSDSFADALINEELNLGAAAAQANLAVAFRDETTAHRILAARDRSASLARVSLLPVKTHLEVSLSVIRILLCGEQYVPFSLMMGDLTVSSGNAAAPVADGQLQLTDREWEVLTLVAQGEQNKTIAHQLELSEHTVKLHVHHVLNKLGASNRTEASMWYHKNAPS